MSSSRSVSHDDELAVSVCSFVFCARSGPKLLHTSLSTSFGPQVLTPPSSAKRCRRYHEGKNFSRSPLHKRSSSTSSAASLVRDGSSSADDKVRPRSMSEGDRLGSLRKQFGAFSREDMKYDEWWSRLAELAFPLRSWERERKRDIARRLSRNLIKNVSLSALLPDRAQPSGEYTGPEISLFSFAGDQVPKQLLSITDASDCLFAAALTTPRWGPHPRVCECGCHGRLALLVLSRRPWYDCFLPFLYALLSTYTSKEVHANKPEHKTSDMRHNYYARILGR